MEMEQSDVCPHSAQSSGTKCWENPFLTREPEVYMTGYCSYAQVWLALRQFAKTCWIPSEVILLIVHEYFRLVIPKFSCGTGSAIMACNKRYIRWIAVEQTGAMIISRDTDLMAPQYHQVYGLPENLTVVCGADFSIGYTSSGRYGWGFNNMRQLGLGDNTTSNEPVYTAVSALIVSISAGHSHAMMITRENSANVLTGWGFNDDGCIGTGKIGEIMDPRVVELSDPVSVVCGLDHSLVMTRDGFYIMGVLALDASKNPGRSTMTGGSRISACPTKLDLSFKPAKIHFCCLSLLVWNDALAITMVSTVEVSYMCEDMWAECSLIGYFGRFPYCGMLRFLKEHDPHGLPGVLLSIDGGDEYMIVTTTRGVYAYVEQYGCPDATVNIQLLCAI